MSAIPTTCSSPLLSTVPRLATRWSKDNLFARIALSRISGREMEDRGLSTGMAPCSAGSHLPHLGTIVVASSFQQIHDTITRSRISESIPQSLQLSRRCLSLCLRRISIAETTGNPPGSSVDTHLTSHTLLPMQRHWIQIRTCQPGQTIPLGHECTSLPDSCV